MRCLDADASKAMVAEIDQAHKDGDTLGGVVEVLAYGVPVGLGSHVHWDRRLDARLAAALMGIQAIKGVEVGDGFELARVPGSKAHDEIVPAADGIRRASGRSGGTEGGMSTGELLRVRAAMKPIARCRARWPRWTSPPARPLRPTTSAPTCAPSRPQGSSPRRWSRWCWRTRSAEKFGGDSVTETRRNVQSLPRQPGRPVTGPLSSWSGPLGSGKSTVGRAARRAARRHAPGHRLRHRRAAGPGRCRRSSSTRASRTSVSWSGRPSGRASPGTRACSPSAVARSWTTSTRELLAGLPVVYPRWTSGRRSGGSASTRAPAARRQSAAAVACADGARRPLYTEVARAVVATDDRTPEEVAQAVLDALELETGMTDQAVTRIQVGGTAGTDPYEVLVGRQLLGELPGLIGAQAPRVAVLHPEALAETGEAVREDLADQGYEAIAIQVPNAEEAKTVEVAAYCWKALGQTGFTRTDVIVGVGGGATTDLAASSPRPGCAACAGSPCPPRCSAWSTRPSAARPASTPPRARTSSGAFHPPPGCCATSPRWTRSRQRLRQRARRDHQGRVHRRPGHPRPGRGRPRGRPHARRAAHRRADRALHPGQGRGGLRRPQGVRAREILNYGHTLAHAIEKNERYKWRHGAAVSVGMVFAAELGRLAGRLDDATADRHRAVLRRSGCRSPTAATSGRSCSTR